MRGIYTSINDIRRKVFTEVARFAYSDDHDYQKIEQLPYEMLPGEDASYRESIFLERAIIGERLRLTMGLPLRRMDQHAPLSEGIEKSAIAEKYYEPPLVNVIKFAWQCLSGKSDSGNRGMSGVSGASMSGGLPEESYLHSSREIGD